MGKNTAKGNTTATTNATQAAAPVVLYHVTPKGAKAGCRSSTKWPFATPTNTVQGANGQPTTGGNLATLQAIAALGATFSYTALVGACMARNHKGFVAYALRNGWVAPVQQ